MVNWTALAAIATIVYSIFAVFQWLAIRRQGDQMEASLQRADRAIDAANRNATAAIEGAQAATRSADVASQTLAITSRGYIQIEPYWIANGDEDVLCRYRYRVEGPTPVVVESGFMRLSIDEPAYPPDMDRQRLSQPLETADVSHRTRDVAYEILFSPLTAEQRNAWNYVPAFTLFLTGEILYRDAFFPTSPKHRKYFGWKWSGRDQWSPNPRVRNDEQDER